MRRNSPGFGIRRQFLSALLVILVAITALGGSFGSQPAAAQDVQTRAIILHGASDLGKVEVSFNGNEVVDDFEYGDQTEWIDLDPGAVEVWISRDRAGFNYTVFGAVYPVPAGNDFYLIITDALVMGGTFDKSPIVLEGAARVGITHASVDTPAVNVVATGDNVDLATQLAYARSSDPVEIPAGDYSAEVRMADTGDVLTTATGTTVGGMVYQYIIIGTPGDEDHPVEVVTLSTESTQRLDATPST